MFYLNNMLLTEKQLNSNNGIVNKRSYSNFNYNFTMRSMIDYIFIEIKKNHLENYNNENSPYHKFYGDIALWVFNKYQKNPIFDSNNKLDYKGYLYEQMRLIRIGIGGEENEARFYNIIAKIYINEFIRELEEKTKEYLRENILDKDSLTAMSSDDFKNNILSKVVIGDIFDYALYSLFNSKEWKESGFVDPTYNKIRLLENSDDFKKIKKIIEASKKFNDKNGQAIYNKFVINHGEFGYILDDQLGSIKKTWNDNHKFKEITIKSLDRLEKADKTSQQKALKELPKINDLGWTPGSGIIKPRPVIDIPNSKLKKYEIDHIRELIEAFNKDQVKLNKNMKEIQLLNLGFSTSIEIPQILNIKDFEKLIKPEKENYNNKIKSFNDKQIEFSNNNKISIKEKIIQMGSTGKYGFLDGKELRLLLRLIGSNSNIGAISVIEINNKINSLIKKDSASQKKALSDLAQLNDLGYEKTSNIIEQLDGDKTKWVKNKIIKIKIEINSFNKDQEEKLKLHKLRVIKELEEVKNEYSFVDPLIKLVQSAKNKNEIDNIMKDFHKKNNLKKKALAKPKQRSFFSETKKLLIVLCSTLGGLSVIAFLIMVLKRRKI